MKTLLLATTLALALATAAYASEKVQIKGYLIDNACSAKATGDKALQTVKNHPISCALSCAGSGYAVMTEQSKLYKLDPDGSNKAAEILKKTKLTKSVAVSVEGELDGDTLKVMKISESEAK